MLAVFLLLVFANDRNKEKGFTRDKCVSMQGAAAVYVMLSHIHTFAAYSSPFVWWLFPVNEVTILTNGMFFFISGYGLWESRKNKEDYLSMRSLLCRLVKLLVPAYIAYLLYYFIMLYCGHENRTSFVKHLLLKDVFSWFYYNSVVWFIIELFFLYVIFWAVYSHWTSAIGNRILFILIVSWTILAAFWGRGYVWYASTLCFLLGTVISQTNGRFILADNKRVAVISILVLIPAFILFIQSSEKLGWLNAVYANISSLLFCILCYLAAYQKPLGNLLSNWLGKFSYEIYLCHMMILKVIDGFKVCDNIKIYGILCASILAAYILYCIDTKLLNVICKYFTWGRAKGN